ncbi:MAG: AEC family transporter [Longimicrobiales bacterium]|nr:AEC family transporter [Longimicrobiales bacterium]
MPLTSLVDVVAPVFGIIAVGFLAARASVLDGAGVKGLVAFVFNFAIPVLMFRSMAGIELPGDVEWGFLVAFYTGSLVTYALGMAVGRWGFARALDQQAVFGMSAAYSNTVFLGIPIILTALGPDAALPLLLIIALHSATFMTLTVALIHLGRGEGISASEQALSVLRELVRNPIVVGLFLGLLANLGSVTLPGFLDRLTGLLGEAAVPCALFAMGASLAVYPMGADGPAALVLAALKLVVHPLIVWTVAVPVLGLDGIWVPAAVLMAAMPTGVNVYLFGARYDAAASLAARTVLVASTLSVVTISLMLLLFGG